jgi:hypothetical protein
MHPGIPYHCSVCGRTTVYVDYAMGGGRWFHTLGSRPVYEPPAETHDWRITHDPVPWPGRAIDRRGEPDGDHFLYPESVS